MHQWAKNPTCCTFPPHVTSVTVRFCESTSVLITSLTQSSAAHSTEGDTEGEGWSGEGAVGRASRICAFAHEHAHKKQTCVLCCVMCTTAQRHYTYTNKKTQSLARV